MRVVNLENQRTLHDSIALTLATFPALLISPPIVTAPAALFLSIFYWKRPTSIVRRHPKIRLVIAMTLSVIQIGIWIALAILMVYQFRKGVIHRVPK